MELVNDQVLSFELGSIPESASGGVGICRFCPYCHVWEVRDQPLGVLGALPGSVQHALLVRQWSDDVVFFVHTYDVTSGEQRQLEALGILVIFGKVARLVVEDDRLTGVELADGRVVARTAVFVRPGNHPNDDGLLAGLGCELKAGLPLVDGTGLTSVPGVWAAGNVADPRAQVITSAGARVRGSDRHKRRPRARGCRSGRRTPFQRRRPAGAMT